MSTIQMESLISHGFRGISQNNILTLDLGPKSNVMAPKKINFLYYIYNTINGVSMSIMSNGASNSRGLKSRYNCI